MADVFDDRLSLPKASGLWTLPRGDSDAYQDGGLRASGPSVSSNAVSGTGLGFLSKTNRLVLRR